MLHESVVRIFILTQNLTGHTLAAAGVQSVKTYPPRKFDCPESRSSTFHLRTETSSFQNVLFNKILDNEQSPRLHTVYFRSVDVDFIWFHVHICCSHSHLLQWQTWTYEHDSSDTPLEYSLNWIMFVLNTFEGDRKRNGHEHGAVQVQVTWISWKFLSTVRYKNTDQWQENHYCYKSVRSHIILCFPLLERDKEHLEIDVGLRATFKDGHSQHFLFKILPPALRLPFAASNNLCQ